MKMIQLAIKMFMIVTLSFLALHINTMNYVNNQANALVCPPGEFPYNNTFSEPTDDNPSGYLTMSCKDPVDKLTTDKDKKDNSHSQMKKYSSYFYNFLKMMEIASTSVAIFLVVLAGNAYIFSGGQTQGVERAKNLLILAIVGFFMMTSSFVIMKIITQVLGVSV